MRKIVNTRSLETFQCKQPIHRLQYETISYRTKWGGINSHIKDLKGKRGRQQKVLRQSVIGSRAGVNYTPFMTLVATKRTSLGPTAKQTPHEKVANKNYHYFERDE